MHHLSSVLVASVLLVSAGCATSGESTRVRDYVGERASKIFASPDRVEVFRMGSSREHPDATQTLAGFPLLSTGKEQGKDFARRLGAVLLNDGTYEWEMANGCIFDPGVAFRVWSGSESVLAIICFHCNQIGIVPDEANPRSLRVHDADPGRPALLKLAREVFPDDVDLQQLTAR
jgi:hypothetical protein